jgi:deoxyribodipyrimidine photo-lyase
MGDTSVLWFRRDLRLADHPALAEAAASGGTVVALFVHDPCLAGPSGANRLAFLHASLDALDLSLGGALVERVGDPTVVVAEVAAEVGAAQVVVTGDHGPYGRRRDDAVEAALATDGRRFERVGSPYAIEPGTIRTRAGTPCKVFTPFRRTWDAHGVPEPIPAPSRIEWHRGVTSDPRPSTPTPTATAGLPPAGEEAATRLLDAFVTHDLAGYATDRDRPDLDVTSRLSPHLKVGSIHPRQILARLHERAGDGPSTFAAELAWRDFYADVLHHRPDTARRNVVDNLDALRWDTGPRADERFAAWCAGRTGYPIVDAGMRQLLAEGWMHNRVRMIVASFLVKDLHLHWRRGAAWFMEHLVDGDLASNQHGWQWTAGTGTDAAPFFRVFNPVAQGKRFDPTGDYVRRYVPELAGVAGAAVHEPWRLAASNLFDGPGPAADYPERVVDHDAERREALARWQATR